MAQLTRAREGRWIGGVCAGIARHFGWDPNIVRLIFVLSVLLPGPQFLIYIVMWIFIPAEREGFNQFDQGWRA